LSKEEEHEAQDTEVRKEDQEKINRFSTLHQREGVLDERLQAKIKEKEDFEEVSLELELADEEELVPYQIGDSFFRLPLEEVQSLLGSSIEQVSEDISALENQISDVKDELERLKVQLYARFGKGINLD
ncbi:hypothetical protein KEM55_002578, partial [Ascosphaera atra]